MAQNTPNIDLYTTSTPNGLKASITLEELGLPYKVHKIDISKNTQKEPWFLEINPNGRIPCMTDTFHDGKQIRLFESGSMMQYLVETYDMDYKISFPPNTREHFEMNSWLFFQNAGLGPMQGQANHFTRYSPEKIEYGIKRYQNESRRLYGVLEKHLNDTKGDYIMGEKCTIADLSLFGWIAASAWAGLDINEFPTLKSWEERMSKRPGVERGRNVPDKDHMKEILKDPKKIEEYAQKSSKWILDGMKQDAKDQKL